jgi:hypothetical protein
MNKRITAQVYTLYISGSICPVSLKKTKRIQYFNRPVDISTRAQSC